MANNRPKTNRSLPIHQPRKSASNPVLASISANPP